MLRRKHLFAEPGVEHWNMKHNDQNDLLFEVTDKKNRAGFVAFQVLKEGDDKIKCVLFVENDKPELNRIENELNDTTVDIGGFFPSFKLLKSIKTESALCGYMLSTKDPKMVEIMACYVDSKLQFTSNHFESIKNMVAMPPKNEIEQPTQRCTLL